MLGVSELSFDDLFRKYSVQFSCSAVSDSLRPHESQHTRPPCPSPTPRVHSNSRPSSWWCHPAISSSVVPFSSCPQSFPASGSSPVSWLFTSSVQSTGASALASVLPVNIHGWFPLGLTREGNDPMNPTNSRKSSAFPSAQFHLPRCHTELISFLF